MRTVYLAGAINGCTDAQAKDWRARVTEAVRGSYAVLDPMARDYRGAEDQNVAAIVSGDYADIAVCDVFLAMAMAPSWGTAMEIHHAFGIGKRVILIADGRISPWLRYHSHAIARTVDAAVELLQGQRVDSWTPGPV
jgi:nucleoside 2-deoxyribosyltransferase